MLLLLLVTACTKSSKMESLLTKLPGNADVVAVVNVKTIMESAGGSIEEAQIKLPSFIMDELPHETAEEFDDYRDFLKGSGVDVDVVALTASFNEGEPMLVFALNDRKKFVNAIEDEGFKEEDEEEGVTYYTKEFILEYDYLAVAEDCAYWIPGVWHDCGFEPIKYLKRLISDVQDAHLAGTAFCQYITSSNVGGVAIRLSRELRQVLREAGVPRSMASLYEGVICMRGELTGDAAQLQIKWFDEDGQPMDPQAFAQGMNLDAKVNSDVLAYIGKNQCLVYAVSMKGFNWDTYMDTMAEVMGLSRSDRSMLPLVVSYLEKFDGTLAIGLGVPNGLQSIANLEMERNMAQEFSFTIACETKPGKANSLIKDIKGLLDAQNMDYVNKANGLVLTVPGVSFSLNAEVKDDVLIISNNPVKRNGDNPVVKEINFSDYAMAAGCVLSKKNPLMKDLNIDRDISISCQANIKEMEANVRVALSGTEKGGFIGRFIKTIMDLVAHSDQLENKYDSYRYGSYDED